MKKILLLIVFCGLFFGDNAVSAQSPAAVSPPLVVKTDSAVKKDSVIDLMPRVVRIRTVYLTASQRKDLKAVSNGLSRDSVKRLRVAYPNSIVRFIITNPLVFLKSRPNDQSRVVIYANGVELKGLCTGWYRGITNLQLSNGQVPVFGKTAGIDIVLKRNDTTKAAWDFLYANTKSILKNSADVDVSIGWEGMSELDKAPKTPNLKIVFYYNWVFISFSALFVLLLAGFFYLGLTTNAIRESDCDSAYSLSLTQLLFWTTLVIAAFIYTLVLTDMPSGFNDSILLMLGISLTTTGAATTIDSRFKQKHKGITKAHTYFIQDLLTSDGNNYSVQRIQVFAWNVVLGLYFIVYTINNKSMPEFSSTLLFMAGISSASYVGAKVPENLELKENQKGG
jgi:hypothetical protein